jgi:hypothetical protein
MEEIVNRRHMGKEHGIEHKRHGAHHHDSLFRQRDMMRAEDSELSPDVPELLLRRHW